jgi:hypothetical protein
MASKAAVSRAAGAAVKGAGAAASAAASAGPAAPARPPSVPLLSLKEALAASASAMRAADAVARPVPVPVEVNWTTGGLKAGVPLPALVDMPALPRVLSKKFRLHPPRKLRKVREREGECARGGGGGMGEDDRLPT